MVQRLLSGLRAAAEPTRLRLLALCAGGEFTVSELTQMLGQSQPRVSRHLKVMCDAGLLERFREGAWVFYRLVDNGPSASLAKTLVALIPSDGLDRARDFERLQAVKQARATAAAAYFRANASRWNQIRSLYVPEAAVEAALLELTGAPTGAGLETGKIDDLLDVGTGTGRMLEFFAPRIRHGVGIDLSREMLAFARANLERAGINHCQVRLGDMYHLPYGPDAIDLVLFHQVLHFADDPATAVAEAARVLRPRGRVAIVDFLPHEIEFLRADHAHRRLGFDDREVRGWFEMAGLKAGAMRRLEGDPLTVGIWTAERSLPEAS